MPYRTRNAARVAGIFLLVVFGGTFFWMQKVLLTLKGRAVANGGTVKTASAEAAARHLFGVDGYVVGIGDLQGDGHQEAIVARRGLQVRGGLSLVTRVAVLTPTQPSGFDVLFDTNRSTDLPSMGVRVPYWHLQSVEPKKIYMEAYADDGQGKAVELHQRIELTWNVKTGRYQRLHQKTDERNDDETGVSPALAATIAPAAAQPSNR